MQNQKITGTTRIAGLLGNPVKHSISPLIHNHAFSSLGIDCCYVPLGCEAEKLGGLISSLRALRFVGANVTIPYKSDVIHFCDELSPLSEITGTVNTLYMDGEKLCGTTTDGDGFLRALTENGFDPQGKKIVILGNGGTARTLAMVLAHKLIPKELMLLGRSNEKVRVLSHEVYSKTEFGVEHAVFGSETAEKALADADLVVNCTPVGMSPREDASPISKESMNKECYYFDAIYNPTETLFLKNARELGASHQNGLQMLLFQGLESFTYWTGETVPVSIFNLDKLLSEINGDK